MGLMSRRPRFLPENRDGVLVEITCRTIGARALLTPGPNPRLFNEVVVGVIGRALEVSPLDLCGAVVAGNHLHCLAVVHEQQQLSRFMHHLGGNLSKEIGGRIRQWRGSFWERRYDAIVVSDEPEAQWARLKYLMSHSVKEGLCERATDWPGVHCAGALVHGEKLEGFWFNRSKEWAARRRGQVYGRYDYATRYLVGFAPLPAFRELSPETYQDRIAELLGEIEREGEIARGERPVAGVEKILNQNPYEPPTLKTKRSPRPLFHARSREARKDFKAELDAFLARYWPASEALRGDRGFASARDFPDGCYPPALAFVGAAPPPRPPSPPTRRLVFEGTEVVERGEIPVVEVPPRLWMEPVAVQASPRSRGQPP
jgi:Transposase IS200 like